MILGFPCFKALNIVLYKSAAGANFCGIRNLALNFEVYNNSDLLFHLFEDPRIYKKKGKVLKIFQTLS